VRDVTLCQSTTSLGMRKLPMTADEDLLEIVMRRYERASTVVMSNRPVHDWANCSATAPPVPLYARSSPSSWPCTQMRSTELAHKNRLASTGEGGVKQPSSRPLSLAGFSGDY
jgi:hypothetical protein